MLAASAMVGRVSLAFGREPDFFAAAAVDGEFTQVIVGRDRAEECIVGLGLRAISPRFVNGSVTPVGYLSSLRVLSEYRRRAGLVARGYRYLRELHGDRRTPFYLTTIAADNATALSAIAAGRADLPRYDSLGNYVTLAIRPARVARRTTADASVMTRLATEADRPRVVEFLKTHGPRRQFFPEVRERDLFSTGGLLQGLRPEDVVLASRGDEIVGVVGAWDQSAFKQVVVRGYSRSLALGRHVYNCAAAWRGWPTLPRPGSPINARYAAIPVVADDNGAVFGQLLGALCGELARRRQPLLLLGLHEQDPLLPLARPWAGMEYVTRLYIVSWPDVPRPGDDVCRRVPYLELGCL